MISESDTSSIEKLNTSKPPAIRFAMISGTITRRTAVTRLAPRFTAASSSSPLVCSSPATLDRTMYGSRRTEYATIRNGTGFGFSEKMLASPDNGPPFPNGQLRLMATYPKAITSPGTASGSMQSASSSARPRTVVRTMMYAITTPSVMSTSIAMRAYFRLLVIEWNESGEARARSKCEVVSAVGTTVPYHCPGTVRLVSTTPTCGSRAKHPTTANAAAAPTPANPASGFSAEAREAFEYMAYAFPQNTTLPSRQVPTAAHRTHSH